MDVHCTVMQRRRRKSVQQTHVVLCFSDVSCRLQLKGRYTPVCFLSQVVL